jgi:Ion channel
VGPEAEGTLEARLPGYRFEIVLALLFATFVMMASAPSGVWARPVIVGLQGGTLVAAFLAARVRRRLMRVGVLVALFAFVSAVVTAAAGSPGGNGPFLLLDVLIVGATPIVIARSVWRRGVVDVRTVLAAVCIYITVGMSWAFVYGVVDNLSSGPFFAQTSHATTADYLYFSFVTLTTVGYGDLTVVDGLARAVAVLEALFGQLYLVTVVAVLVSRLAQRRRDGSGPDSGHGTT